MKTVKLLLMFALFTGLSTFAQTPPVIDIQLVDVPGQQQFEVYLIPNGDYSGLISQLTFTIRWPQSDGSVMINYYGNPEWNCSNTSVFLGGPVLHDGYYHQIVISSGRNQLSTCGNLMAVGSPLHTITIEYTGLGGQYEIINDAWTNNTNGDYYISLNGINSTGITIATGAVDIVDSFINNSNIWIQGSIVTVEDTLIGNYVLQIFDVLGREHYYYGFWTSGQRTTISTPILTNGTYIYNITNTDGYKLTKIVNFP